MNLDDGNTTTGDRIKIANLLINAYALERYTFLFLTTISSAGLMGLAVWIVVSRQVQWQTFIGLFAPTGIIISSQSRVLYLWNKTADILMGTWKGGDQHG